MGNKLSQDAARDVPITNGEATIEIQSEANKEAILSHQQQATSVTSYQNEVSQGKGRIIPHQYQSILKHSDTVIDENHVTQEKLYQLLHDGVSLNQKRKKFWLDKKWRKNCFMLYARDLSITWADTSQYWRWIYLKDTPGDDLIEVAELVNVCWLEAHARFDTSMLSQGTTYQVVFVIMVRLPSYGWHMPVNFRLTLPDGSKQEHKERLDEKPREQWIEILAGEITTPGGKGMGGEMKISMFEIEGGNWKSGIAIKGVVIRPKE